ncbi:hypothetical protein ACOME3_005539 [Neoechinorhynchus agilis]
MKPTKQFGSEFTVSETSLKPLTILSARKSIQLIQESKSIGTRTLHELADQSEKFRRIQSDLDCVDQSLSQTKRHIRRLRWRNVLPFTLMSLFSCEKWMWFICGSCLNRRSKSKQPIKIIKLRSISEPNLFGTESTDQLNSALVEMSKGLAGLKSMAMEMNAELNDHSELIDSTNIQIDQTNKDLDDQCRDLMRISKRRF